MCGIAGVRGSGAAQALGPMMHALEHRGPDGRGARVDDLGGLGHLRLAIIDPAGGQQPLLNEDGSMALVLNGEIYNYQSLRERLSRHTLRTGSDGEVALHLYEEEGPAMLRRLLGMYAIAIRDAQGRLFLARDPMGIKPLYWGRDPQGRLLFGSEIKALLSHTTDVRAFPPGHYYLSGHGVHRFYQRPAAFQPIRDHSLAVRMIRRRLEEAVARCLVSDVEVGVFLSGGLDSSLVAAIARRLYGPGLKSFAVGMVGSADLAYARQCAADLGTEHHELAYTPEDVEAALPGVIHHLESYDVPLVRSAVATHFASLLAARYVKVVLTGEGADELFAGYHYLKQMAPFPQALGEELRRITAGLHRSNLQRADRLSMAHGLEARVPFLELPVVNLAFNIHPGLKLGPEGKTEKWLLRKAAEAFLPQEVVWRKKEKFSLGTGSGQFLEQYARDMVTPADFALERELPWGARLHSPEEVLYWRHFKGTYGVPEVVRRMGRARTVGDYDFNPATAAATEPVAQSG